MDKQRVMDLVSEWAQQIYACQIMDAEDIAEHEETVKQVLEWIQFQDEVKYP